MWKEDHVTGREFMRLALMLIVFWAPGISGAEPPGPQAKPPAESRGIGNVRMAWVNFDQLVAECDEGKTVLAELQKLVEEKTREAGSLRKEIDTLRNQLSLQQEKLTDEARADLEEQVISKETNLQRFQQDTQKQIDNRRARLGRAIQKKAQPVIERISKERGLGVVVYINNLDVWVDKSLVITDEVVRAYNATYPISPGPAKKP
jgi:Skp family chaperone for outer membrane proteins